MLDVAFFHLWCYRQYFKASLSAHHLGYHLNKSLYSVIKPNFRLLWGVKIMSPWLFIVVYNNFQCSLYCFKENTRYHRLQEDTIIGPTSDIPLHGSPSERFLWTLLEPTGVVYVGPLVRTMVTALSTWMASQMFGRWLFQEVDYCCHHYFSMSPYWIVRISTWRLHGQLICIPPHNHLSV